MSNSKEPSMLIQMRQFWIVLRLRSAMVFFWDQGVYKRTWQITCTNSCRVHIYAATHSVSAKERDAVLERALPVKIGKNCWMYVFKFYSIILTKKAAETRLLCTLKIIVLIFISAGVSIGKNATIVSLKNNILILKGAGSVVTKNIPENCVAVGCPAKVIKYI